MTLKRHNFYPGDIPAKPGCYLYRDLFGTVIYVGKASNLRRRMSQYFQPSRENRADPKLRSLINSIETWEFITVRSEEEALILESRLIKEFAPHYNILMRDDKRMLMLKLDPAETFPRLKFARLKKDDSCLYFGPYPKTTDLKRTAEYLIRKLKLRTCKCASPTPEDRQHCLAGAVRDCCEPCTGRETPEGYAGRIEKLISILNGRTEEETDGLKQKMQEAAEKHQFEKAAAYRDILASLDAICKQKRRSFLLTASQYGTDPGPGAVADLRNALKLDFDPVSIECFDISNISGTLAVASMVHFTDGRPDRGKYRRFRIRTVEGPNDFAMMKEAVSRRFARVLKGEEKAPSILMVDGGAGQLSSAIDILAELNVPPFPVIGLAEKHEEIYIPGRREPLRLPADRPALHLLQAIRDEAHRFAITYHRALRLAAIQNSLLDEIEGIGEVRKIAILKEFGSVRTLRKASPEEIARRVDGIGPEFARQIYDYLQAHKPDGSADPL